MKKRKLIPKNGKLDKGPYCVNKWKWYETYVEHCPECGSETLYDHDWLNIGETGECQACGLGFVIDRKMEKFLISLAGEDAYFFAPGNDLVFIWDELRYNLSEEGKILFRGLNE